MNTIVRIAVNEEIDRDKVDNKIVLLAQTLKEQEDCDICIITEDIHERVLADIHEVQAESVNIDAVDVTSLYSGKARFKITDNQVQEFYKDYGDMKFKTQKELYPNQLCIMSDSHGGTHYGVYDADEGLVRGLKPTYQAWGVRPKKSDRTGQVIIEQSMLMHLLLDPEVELVTAIGPSGCGKTLLTLACALEQTMKEDTYNKVIVMRPLVSIGKDIGALPGDKLEKLEPWMASTFDNLEFLLDNHTPKDMEGMYISTKEKVDDLAVQSGVARAIDFAHSTCAKL
jgi:PhoH-like ATPase